MKEEKRISYRAGITRSPSDFLCGDGELAECINLTTDGEELKVVPDLNMTIGSIAMKIVYVHRLPNKETPIYILESDGSSKSLYYNINGASQYLRNSTHTNSVTPAKITAIGRTLSVSLDDEVAYYMWNQSLNNGSGGYDYYGVLPSLKIEPKLKSFVSTTNMNYEMASGSGDGILNEKDKFDYDPLKQEQYNELIVGIYEKTLRQIAQKKGFAKPFFVRAALEMVDGTYTQISNPVLMWPTLEGNTMFTSKTTDKKVNCFTKYYNLIVSQEEDYSQFSDIVKDVVIFVSDGINVYDLLSDQEKQDALEISSGTVTVGHSVSLSGFRMVLKDEKYNLQSTQEAGITIYPLAYKLLEFRPYADISADVCSTSVFYKLCSIGLSRVTELDLRDKFDTHLLETLTNQPRLGRDDFYSRCPLSCSMLYGYNGRLNMGGVKRGFFAGFDCFMPWQDTSSTKFDYKIYVRIKTADGYRTVKKTIEGTYDYIGPYFFYPDSRADRVTIKRNGTIILNANLEAHTGLNGAYYYYKYLIQNQRPDAFVYDDGQTPLSDADVSTSAENLSGVLLQSQVNNPFVVLSDGYHQVGLGSIIAMSAVTMALSQDQFGRTDLVVFTNEGIWGMQVGSDGTYENCHPLSRDICINAYNIIQVDSAVFFVSKRGLMVVDENGRVSCVSEKMNGKAFDTSTVTYLKKATLNGNAGSPWATTVDNAHDSSPLCSFLESASCRIAYDYTESRLLLTEKTKLYCWVYSLKDGSFSKLTLPDNIYNVVNSYPDYLLQDNHDKVYSLYDKAHDETSATRQTAFLLTRPMKLAGPLTVTSLRELVNVGMWDESAGSSVKTEVLVSDNLKDWHLQESRFGAAAKYYRLALFIKMLPTERLSGTIVTQQERRTDNLRA